MRPSLVRPKGNFPMQFLNKQVSTIVLLWNSLSYYALASGRRENVAVHCADVAGLWQWWLVWTSRQFFPHFMNVSCLIVESRSFPDTPTEAPRLNKEITRVSDDPHPLSEVTVLFMNWISAPPKQKPLGDRTRYIIRSTTSALHGNLSKNLASQADDTANLLISFIYFL